MNNIEIERRWMISNLDSIKYDYDLKDKEIISQIYIQNDTLTVLRIRTTSNQNGINKGFVTVKGQKPEISKYSLEYEMPIDFQLALDLMKNKKILTKTRYTFVEKNKMHELAVDEFQHHFSGLIIGEIEFESESEADNFIAPEYFRAEITDDKSYTNSNLYKKILRLK